MNEATESYSIPRIPPQDVRKNPITEKKECKAMNAATVPAPTPESPDAALLRLCARLIAGHARSEALSTPWYSREGRRPPEVDRKIEAEVAQYHKLRSRISKLPALTVAGLQAKARVALIEFNTHEGDPPPDECVAWSLCREIAARA